MAFRKKAEIVLAHKPDILVVPECEHPDKLMFRSQKVVPTDSIWFGRNPNKGIGIFSYSDYRFRLFDGYNPELKMIIPVSVSKGRNIFTLFAIWANNPEDHKFQYVGQIWKAIHFYEALLKEKNTMLIGDFNSNAIWDRPRREGNHSALVELLRKKNIISTYHHHFKLEQGSELHPTLFMYKHKGKCYHIDYCFVSKNMLKKLQSVEIGDYDYWKQYSDHAPLLVTFNIK